MSRRTMPVETVGLGELADKQVRVGDTLLITVEDSSGFPRWALNEHMSSSPPEPSPERLAQWESER